MTVHTFTFSIRTYGSGALGCGAVFGNNGSNSMDPQNGISIIAKELVPIVCSCAVRGPQLAKQSINYFTVIT